MDLPARRLSVDDLEPCGSVASKKLQRLGRITKVKQGMTKVIVLRGARRHRPLGRMGFVVSVEQHNTSLNR